MWINIYHEFNVKILVVRRITGRLTNGYPAAVLVVPDKRISVYFEHCLRVIDPLFFLWKHKFQLKFTIMRPLGRACIHNGVKISHGKPLTISQFRPPNYQNIELHVAGELVNRSKLYPIISDLSKIYWKECVATTGTTSTRSWHSACCRELPQLISSAKWLWSWTP